MQWENCWVTAGVVVFRRWNRLWTENSGRQVWRSRCWEDVMPVYGWRYRCTDQWSRRWRWEMWPPLIDTIRLRNSIRKLLTFYLSLRRLFYKAAKLAVHVRIIGLRTFKLSIGATIARTLSTKVPSSWTSLYGFLFQAFWRNTFLISSFLDGFLMREYILLRKVRSSIHLPWWLILQERLSPRWSEY